MANDIAVIDRFLDIFSRYIDSGFGLISGDVGFLVKILIGIDVVLAALAWAAGEDEVIQAFAKKVLYVAFFVLAIMLFLAVIEFKLTTLKGFILVPFALWRGTSFIAEPVLGQVITSGVRILVFAVVTGIGTQIFSQILPSSPTAELSLQD